MSNNTQGVGGRVGGRVGGGLIGGLIGGAAHHINETSVGVLK